MDDTFTWPVQIQEGMEGQFIHRVRTAQFGDGYKQVSGDGINPETQSWPVTLTGKHAAMLPVLTFVRGHVTRAFIWTPPFGTPSLWRVAADSIRATPLSSQVMTVTATFEQAYAPQEVR
ncbi:phage tail protein [Salmonella enterica]